jgi:hypothetical protein
VDPVLVSTIGDELAGPAILDALRYGELLYCLSCSISLILFTYVYMNDNNCAYKIIMFTILFTTMIVVTIEGMFL